MGIRAGRAVATAAIATATLPWLSCGAGGSPGVPSPAPGVSVNLLRLREDALARAQVWQDPPAPIAQADLGHDPPGLFNASDDVVCRYEPKFTRGQTPKFYCAVPDGPVIKVKYGRLNAEPRTEPAASRLLSALGFGADRMFVVRSVRCTGCPVYPHPRWGLVNLLFTRDGSRVRFEDVSIEEPLPGRSIEAGETEGWAWYELEKIDPGQGGASRAERDALSLMAVFLGNWDNKARNQRLLCPPGGDTADGGCRNPFAYMQDVGATFGPKGLNLEAWKATPIWADPAACRVSMKALPYQGATFRDTVISEGGRRFLAEKLTQLRPQQLRDLFTGTGFTKYAGSSAAGRDAANWVAAFQDKVRQIADRPPCPDR